MSDCTLISNGDDEVVIRHEHTGHEFTYKVEGGTLTLGPVKEGHGPKDPGDVAADAHAAAMREARRLGLV